MKLFLKLRIWQLILLSLVFFAGSLFALRSNHLHMTELRDQVVAADAKGEGVEEAINQLRGYIFTHMNTSTKVALVEMYDRAHEQAQQEAQGTVDNKLYQRAWNACADPSFSRPERTTCVINYINTNAKPGQNPTPVKPPIPSEYIYSFVSPVWSFDVAGITLMLGFLFALLAVIRYIIKEELLLFPNLKQRLFSS